MAELRFSALREVFSREPVKPDLPGTNISGYFSLNVFDLPKMERYLPRSTYLSVRDAIDRGTTISKEEAD